MRSPMLILHKIDKGIQKIQKRKKMSASNHTLIVVVDGKVVALSLRNQGTWGET